MYIVKHVFIVLLAAVTAYFHTCCKLSFVYGAGCVLLAQLFYLVNSFTR